MMAIDYGLKEIIKNDGSLEASEKMAFISLVHFFEKDFTANLKRTSLELDIEYGTNDPTLWNKFLNHTSVRNFIENYLNEEIEKRALKALAEGDQKETNKALKIVEAIDKKKKTEDNTNIYVMLLPSKEDDIGL